MKSLYLIRHAKSSWDDPFQDDLDRPLNGRGQRDAPRMGSRLKDRGVVINLLLTSPAQRALSTCMLMAEQMFLTSSMIRIEHGLYHAGDKLLMNIVRGQSDGLQSVALCGHNPGLTEFSNRLMSRSVTDNIPTSGVVSVALPVTSWKDVSWETGRLIFFDYPKKETF